MWLLDANMPKKIADVLGEFGIQAQAADARGWKALTNGALVEAAVRAGFACVLTRDKLFSESAARALKRFPHFGVVLVNIPQLRGPEFVAQFRTAWSRHPIQPVAGELVRWPYGS
jgi:predicted nuclease of predicted toxin-antitoxin system